MIYCLISNAGKRVITDDSREGRIIDSINFPESRLPDDIKDYIDKTKNEQVRSERFSAYTSLLCGLKTFYGIDNFSIKRTDRGKPYIVTNEADENNSNGDKKIYISVSHSDGLSAVALTNEGEIGVDIQSLIEPDRAERVDKRFLSELSFEDGELDLFTYFLRMDGAIASVEENTVPLLKASIPQKNDSSLSNKNNVEIITSKWTLAESCMKAISGGFSDLEILKNRGKNIISGLRKIDLEIPYYLAISIIKK